MEKEEIRKIIEQIKHEVQLNLDESKIELAIDYIFEHNLDKKEIIKLLMSNAKH